MKFKQIFLFGLTNMWRNKFLSLSTILIIGLILFVLNVILSIHLIARAGLSDLQKKVDIILYLRDDSDQFKISQFIAELEDIPTVEEVIFTSKEEALSSLLNRYPLAVNPFQKYNIENPLPSHINIITTAADKHEIILALADSSIYSSLFLTSPETSENQKIVAKLLQFTTSTTRVLITTLVIFIVTSLLIISNAITLSIYHKREELNIMKLVGASPYTIRGPFLIEGVIYGLTGFILSTILLGSFLSFTELDLISFRWDTNIYKFILLEGIVCVGLGVVSSMISTEKYLLQKK